MAVTASTFKARFTVFSSLSDAVVETALAEAGRRCSSSAFGTSELHDDAVGYLAGHILAQDAAMNAAGSPAASAGAGDAGAVASKSAMGQSISYAVPEVFSKSALATTAWGRRYLELTSLAFPARVF